MVEAAHRQAAQRGAFDRVARTTRQCAKRLAGCLKVQFERIAVDLFAGAQRVLDVAIEVRVRRRRWIGIDSRARRFRPTQRQAMVVIKQDKARAG